VVRSSAPEPEPVVRVAPAPAPSGGGGTGTLRVNTRPWSKVFVDGRLIGNTPQMNISLSAGRHTITLVNDDFGIRKTVKVDIRAGEVETQVLTLTE
jgi:eukaryotic-like serine/threonine-protein kinase